MPIVYRPARAEELQACQELIVGSIIAIRVAGSSFPNWTGTDQKRIVAVAGDKLTLTVRPPNGDVVDVIWKQAN
jgi:hypothetical protein